MNRQSKKLAFTLFFFMNIWGSLLAAIPGTPELSFSTAGQDLTLTWSQVNEADGYVLYYAPYPSADPVGSLDVGNLNQVVGELPYGSSFYLAVQAYNEDGAGDFSNIEQFTLRFAEIIYFDNPIGDVSTIVYGDADNSLIIFGSEIGPSSTVVNYTEGTQAEIFFNTDGSPSSIEIDGYTFSYSYGTGTRLIEFTDLDGSKTSISESSQESEEIEEELESTKDIVRSPIKDLQNWLGSCWIRQSICDTLSYAGEQGLVLVDSIGNRVSRNYKRFGTYVSCNISYKACAAALKKDGPEVWPEYANTSNQNTDENLGGGFDVFEDDISPDSAMRAEFASGSITCDPVFGLSNSLCQELEELAAQNSKLCDPSECVPNLAGIWIRNNNVQDRLNILQTGSNINAVWISASDSCLPQNFVDGKSSFRGTLDGALSSGFTYSTWSCSNQMENTRTRTFTISLSNNAYTLSINGNSYTRE